MTQAGADSAVDLAAVQRRTVRTLVASQILGGVGVAAGIAVGSLVAESVSGSTALAGLTQTSAVLGAAVAAVPLSRLMSRRGRRVGLVLGYLTGTAGALLVIAGAAAAVFPLVLAGALAFGTASATGLQSRYAATDLAPASARASALSTVVWATTLGAVLGPNLSGPTAPLARGLGLPALVGPYVASVAAFLLAAAVIGRRLRPDPLVLARENRRSATAPSVPTESVGEPGANPAPGTASAPSPSSAPSAAVAAMAADDPDTRLRTAWQVVRGTPAAVLGVVAVVTAHTVMVSVMVMTPVHVRHDGGTLRVVGLIISVHVLGMYAFSPLVGRLADRVGPARVVGLSAVVLVLACALAGSAAPQATPQLAAGLLLLGVGWSFGLVGGSTAVTAAVPDGRRASVQGLTDLLMGGGGAAGGAMAGIVVAGPGFGWLAAGAALLVLPVAVLAVRSGRTVGVSPA